MPPVEPPRADVARVALRLPSSSPLVTYLIMGLTILVFIAQEASQYLLGNDIPAALGMKVNSAIIAGQYYRLLTPLLLHGSILHILFNMYALFVIGPAVERSYGHMRYLMLYLLGGLAGNVASFWLSAAPSLGASTAIFGLIGAQGIFFYQNRRMFGDRARSMLANIGGIILINLFLGFSMSGIIDNWGHLGGLLGGGVFALLAGPLFAVEGYYPDVRLVDRRAGLVPYLVALVEAAALVLIASFRF
jgi:rhomboid protease GluP